MSPAAANELDVDWICLYWRTGWQYTSM